MSHPFPTGTTLETRANDDKKRTLKDLFPTVPSTGEVAGEAADKAGNRTGQLPVGGKLVHFTKTWTQQFPQHYEIVRKVSQGILLAFDDVPPQLLRHPLELLSNNKVADLQHAVQKLCLSQAIEEVVDPTSPGYYSRLFLVPKPDGSFRPILDLKKLNQFIIVPSFKMETLFSIIAALQPNEWITKIDLKDAYHHILVHQEILQVCCSRNSLPIQGSPIWSLNGSERVHKDTSSCCSSLTFSRHPGPCLSGRLDHPCFIQRTESSSYSTSPTTSSVTGMDNKLGQIYVTALPHSGLSGPSLQFRTSPNIFSGLVLTYSHRSPLPSIYVDSHVCSQGFIYYQQAVPFCPIYNQWPSTSTFPPTLVQGTMDSTSSVMGHSNQTRFGLPLISPLVPPSIRDDGSSVTSTGPQSLLLHGCISQRMGSQLADTTDFRSLVTTGIQTPHQLAGIRSHSSSPSPLGPTMDSSDSPGILRQQYSSSIHPEAGRHSFQSSLSQDSRTLPITGSVCDYSHTHTSSWSPERHRRCSVSSSSAQPNGMASSTSHLKQTVLCLRDSPDRYVCNSGEQSDAHLRFSLPRRQSMGGRRPVPILGRFGPDLRLSPGSHSAQDDPENTEIPRYHGHSDSVSTPVTAVASSVAPVEHRSQDSPDQRSTLSVCTQPPAASIPQRSQTVGSSRVALIQDILTSHRIPDTVVDMAADPLRDSSSHVYNSHWKAFAIWANEKGLHPKDLSFFTLAEYLIHLFSLNKKVNTILVHKASISSVFKLLNPPTTLQESTLQNVIRRMNILRPQEQEVLPRWHLSVVLKGLMKPPFTINGSDRQISLELLSYKTAFLVALASGARGSELVALSRASHNLDFTMLPSGAKQVSIRMVPKFIPKNQRPEVIPEPIVFPGMAHLFPKDPERLLCPVRALGLYIVRSAERAQTDPLEKLFVHFTPNTQLFTTHFRRWVAETIRLTYENSSQSDLPKIRAHDVRGISASIAYYRNTPLKELCGLIGWKSSNVFVRHYLRDMASDTELQDIPLVAARTAFL